ncbi:adenosylmethionine decarboxylase [Chitinimonas sp. BJB300]|uniref:adenosylmethionine decarboxylase n=1 Tax=Chitinimonas sp. BJB300 TaxID=1559339 RepID=UPI000C0E53E8|nr:adenosylmethionine decarboxylase [Chitinimonas sp. BJB300]PHV12652.1 adenosylmethionine decarboxylase [Chitinimonas sp. BJB300]TSJ91186.1 adenosylmethionine decarboxylase [Chitinimonas sp. BJB300]
MNGLHLTADLYDCANHTLLVDESALADLCRHEVAKAGLQAVGERWHCFPPLPDGPGGITGVVLLAESHLAIHTWPERTAVTLDVYVCNFGRDNSNAAQALLAALMAGFKPARSQCQQLQRGNSN